MQIFQGIILIWTRTYKEIFKSALVYLYTLTNNYHLPTYVNRLAVLPNCLIWRPATQHIKNCIMIVVLILIIYWEIICVTNRIIYGANITSRNFYFCLHTYVNFCSHSFFWEITLVLFVIMTNKFLL